MTFKELQERAYRTAVDKGWHDNPVSPGDRLALIHSEVSEALEAYRSSGKLEVWYDADSQPMGKPEGLWPELADVVIRIMDWAGSEGVDMVSVILEKMEYNEQRSYRHGGKKL
jgi:NTP pyrophosphatase (non-canonical NTP hydrolase)